MVAAEDDALDMLKYCLSGSAKDIPTWGHEYRTGNDESRTETTTTKQTLR